MKLPTLDEFVGKLLEVGKWSANNNSYVKEPGFKALYVRVTQRYIDGKLRWPVLDIANVEVKDKGKGKFTALISRLREKYPAITIYIECVQTERFGKKLETLGFIQVPNLNSYYILPTNKR